MIYHDGTRLTQAPEEAAHTGTVPVRRYTQTGPLIVILFPTTYNSMSEPRPHP
jgi:hypothetical protein